MSIIIKELVRRKLKQTSDIELLDYSQQYGFSISKEQAKQISNFLKHYNGDPFRHDNRETMFRELANITDLHTAKAARKLLNELIKSYGLEYLFE
ncbi:DUF2624 family protein [Oceanobacillus sp. Castelsardo]|uniref:DUF2624 family protein n=1 Tax=Oceanobacillus sp. Castelsardo TaxID=1851204 RepID=UPI00083926C3|nr:DUF2624 family protein [Oceanobacillus sp. Castelsardo]